MWKMRAGCHGEAVRTDPAVVPGGAGEGGWSKGVLMARGFVIPCQTGAWRHESVPVGHVDAAQGSTKSGWWPPAPARCSTLGSLPCEAINNNTLGHCFPLIFACILGILAFLVLVPFRQGPRALHAAGYLSTCLRLVKVKYVLKDTAEPGPEMRSGKMDLRLFC